MIAKKDTPKKRLVNIIRARCEFTTNESQRLETLNYDMLLAIVAKLK